MKNQPKIFYTLSELHKAMEQPKPLHPLISIINYGEAIFDPKDFEQGIIMDFYKISFKTSFNGKIKYGHGFYDFEEGGMSFVAPGQLLKMQEEEADYSGMSLHIHPDFIRPYALNANIKQYGFFNYTASEALYLSENEKETILGVYNSIQNELKERIDNFSQDVIISQIELLLNYSNRFYNRQFITRKAINNDVLAQLESLLNSYFNDEEALLNGLPTVAFVAEQLKLSPRYLSDLLRNLSGKNTQHFIHDKLIEKAKEYIMKGNFSIAEIAYKLGFEHPQSFNKLFKQKTNSTPIAFQKSFHKN
ncbi:AraC family transcriptional regulator [Flavobacterium circumlabens]|uniref:AraC family transcriptional regulator n=1 Tax=Flavobacterium circumlabens TaxID=2133765 RepID=A0A4Y7UA23_9FLAO|nr:AraC family transcriptional regulator [Flavobacterium circumlabens]TCN55455.1 AraC-like DNA-binding protein [Flavobacterium circumlabens]TEB43134.1 AraC family transcriptional regulator [Flavobacterium circumlabens]